LTRPVGTQSADLSVFIQNYRAMLDSTKHFSLQHDLIAHLWAQKGVMDTGDSESE
jgi:hypothetical protein